MEAISIIGGADGPTFIYVSTTISLKMILIYSLLIVFVDLVILAIIYAVKRVKRTEKIRLWHKVASVFAVNLILSVLIPGMFIFAMLIAVVIAVVLLIVDLKMKAKRKN